MSSGFDRNSWMRWLPDPLKRENLKLGITPDTDDAIMKSYAMTLVFNTERWIFTSNGAAMLLVKDTINWREMSSAQSDTARGYLMKEIVGKAVSLDRFRQWLGHGWVGSLRCDCAGDWAKHCTSCWGDGMAQSGCPRCNKKHECHCQACNGEGVLYCAGCAPRGGYKRKQGKIGHALFDRCLAARFLAQVPSPAEEQITIMHGAAHDAIWIEPSAKNWRCVVMPLREATQHEKVPEWQ